MILATVIITQCVMLITIIALIHFHKTNTRDFLVFIKELNKLLLKLEDRQLIMKKEIDTLKERQSDFDVLKHGSI